MKKWLVRILKTLGLLIVLFLIAVSALALYWKLAPDSAPPDFSALTPHSAEVPDAQNGFLALANSDLQLSKKERDICAHALASNGYFKWDQAQIDSLLAKHTDVLTAVDRALAMPGFEIPVMSPEYGIYFMRGFENCAKLEALSAKNHFRKGDHATAYQQDWQLIELGRRIEKCGFLDYVIGFSITANGRVGIQSFVNQSTAKDRPLLEEYSRKLAAPFDEVETFQEALRRRFEKESSRILKLSRGESFSAIFRDLAAKDRSRWSPEMNRRVADASGKVQWPQPNWFTQVFITSRIKPNATLRVLAKRMLQNINAAPFSYVAISKAANHEFPDVEKKAWKELIFAPNFYGNWIVERLTPKRSVTGISFEAETKKVKVNTVPVSSNLQVKCRAKTNDSLLQTMIALRLYALDHNGELPDSLTAIVPQYLSAIPLDDFDGKPIRYSKAHRIIYSVGKNLKDNGGVFASPSEKRDTPHIDLAWK